METRKEILLLFGLLFALNSLVQAQEKSIREELQELRERTRMQNEILGKPNSITLPAQEAIQQKKQEEEKYEIIFRRNEIPILNQSKNKKWSLEECIQYAINQNINIKQLQLQQELAGIQQNTAKNSRLPNLNASMEQEWNFGRIQDLLGEFNDRNQSRTSFNAQSIVPIFTGFRIPNQVERTKFDFHAATQDLEKAKEDLSLNITFLFLQVLLNKELYNISVEQLELVETQVERTILLVEAGNVPKFQLYDIEAQVAKDSVTVIEAQNYLDLALLDLAQSLELERNTDFDIYIPNIEGDIISIFSKSLQPPDIIYENAINFKPVIKGQEYRVESSRKALKVAESGYYPQIDFLLGIGTNYYHVFKPSEQINPITNEPMVLNHSFPDQIRNYGARLFGFNMSIPVFNRYQVRNQVSSAKIDILNQQLILENNKKTLYKEIQTAYKNATAAQEKYRASWRAVKASSESFEYARRRYELGSATVFEFNEARTRFIQSQSEQAQAKYEYILRTKILDFYNGIPIKL